MAALCAYGKKCGFLGGLILSVLFILPVCGIAQERDTTRRSIEIDKKEEAIKLKYRLDRPASAGMLSESGVHAVPEPTRYFKPPFKGQEYLDQAVEAYRKELGPAWLANLFRAISPFINNRFEFGVYRIYDMPLIDRDNPLLQSSNSKEKLE